MSTRRGAWIVHRVWDNGIPVDVAANNRLVRFIFSLLPANSFSAVIEKKLNAKFDHELYGLKPAHRYEEQHPTVNDDLPNRIIAGVVIVKPDIK